MRRTPIFLLAGIAGLVAGAMSMATGEYVSVHSQADTEAAALAQEKVELEVDYAGERRELTEIYVRRGLEKVLARQVAEQLMAHDALGTHARDELGLSTTLSARPVQAALTSAGSFSVGAAMPLAVAVLAPPQHLMPAIVSISIICLVCLGGIAAKVGRGERRHGRDPRDFLECPRHGHYRRGWRPVRVHRLTPLTNRRVVLAQRPTGAASVADLRLEAVPVGDLADGQVLLRTLWLSLDPYMRGRMSDAASYAAPVEVGGVMTGGTVARVGGVAATRVSCRANSCYR